MDTMIESVRKVQKSLEDLYSAIGKIHSKQIYQTHIIEGTRSVVDNYFRNARDILLHSNIDTAALSELDETMQSLLEATHKRTTLLGYKKAVSRARNAIVEIEKLTLLALSGHSKSIQLDKVDTMIIDTLKKLVLSAALSYEQALIDMQVQQRLSWRGPAADLREALRECLDCLAPDKEVLSSSGFKLEPNVKGPTMKQKTQYVLQKRSSSKNSLKTLKNLWASSRKCLVCLFVQCIHGQASRATL